MSRINPSQWIGTTLTITIDRPLGTTHPVHGFLYPVNYGYLPGILGGDGEELDAYVVGITEPLNAFTGECIAVIHRLDDDDDKLVLVSSGMQFTDGEIRCLTHFQEQWFRSEIWR
jgi:inorganic pyrophosphatase